VPARETAGGIVVALRLTPKAGRDEVTGLEIGADGLAFLMARVRALPEKGKANAALAALIADWLALPKSTCAVVSGGKSRLKQVLIRGETATLMRLLKARIARLQAGD
jgi:uncharacterized protein YggU (UPF0235/DUF167 family)